MQIFSNVFIHPETGDVLGYELAIRRNHDSSVDALLYTYEGGGSDSGIPLSGKISAKLLTVQGVWVERLLEMPSKRAVEEKHLVKFSGVLSSVRLRGKLTIDGLIDGEQVQLRSVKKIWPCN